MLDFFRYFLLPVGFLVLSVITVMILLGAFFGKIESNKRNRKLRNEWNKQMSQANQKFDGNILANTILQKILATPYIDICVYPDRVEYSNTTLRFSDYQYTNVSNFYLLAIWIMQRLPNKELYVIEKITYITKNAVGYKLHNKNFDGRYLKVWNSTTGTYDNWDPKRQEWVKKW